MVNDRPQLFNLGFSDSLTEPGSIYHWKTFI